jgi:hypothetical protein
MHKRLKKEKGSKAHCCRKSSNYKGKKQERNKGVAESIRKQLKKWQ